MARVSSETRSVLAAMVSNADWLRATLEPSYLGTDVMEGLLDIQACCERLTGLLEDASLAMRPEGLEPHFAFVSVGAMTASVLQRLSKRMAAARVSVGRDGDTDATAMLDRFLLCRMLELLLERDIEDMSGAKLSLRHASDGRILTLSLVVQACRCTGASRKGKREPCGCLRDDSERCISEFCEMILRAHGGGMSIRPAKDVRWAVHVPVVPKGVGRIPNGR